MNTVMNPDNMQPATRGPSDASHDMEEPMKMPAAGHLALSADDPDNPQNFPIFKKTYVSTVAFVFAFVV